MNHALVLSLALVACGGGKPASSTTPPASTTDSVCAELAEAITASNTNFPDGSRRALTGATCTTGQPDPSYPDHRMTCTLGAAGTKAAATPILATWGTRVKACPALADFVEKPRTDGSFRWERETGDNHIHIVQIDVEGDEPTATPTLTVGRPEI